jgi:hypothetical protein
MAIAEKFNTGQEVCLQIASEVRALPRKDSDAVYDYGDTEGSTVSAR